VKSRLVVLASGNGSNAQAIIDACAGAILNATVVVVISDVSEAFALTRARQNQIEALCVQRAKGESRTEYDRRLCTNVISFRPDVVVLVGWMRILSAHFLDNVQVPVVNLHPALPGELPGINAIQRAFDERDAGRRESGVMVHLVPDEGVDSGPVIGVRKVPLLASDSFVVFEKRMHCAEHELLIEALAEFLTQFNVGGDQ